jgi:hypothetical protein
VPEGKTTTDAYGLEDPRMQAFMASFERAWTDPRRGDHRDCWTEDAEEHLPGRAEPVRGREAIVALVDGFLRVAPDLTVTPVAAAENGSTLFVQLRFAGTFGGRRVEWEGVDRFDFPAEGARANRGEAFFSPPVAIDGLVDADR